MSLISFIFGKREHHSSKYEIEVTVTTTITKAYEPPNREGSRLNLSAAIGVDDDVHSVRTSDDLGLVEDGGSLTLRRSSICSTASAPGRIEHTAHQTLTTKVKIHNSDGAENHSERVTGGKLPDEIARLMKDIVHTVTASSALSTGEDHFLTGVEEDERSDVL